MCQKFVVLAKYNAMWGSLLGGEISARAEVCHC